MPEIDLDQKVLVVEDAESMRRIIRSVLRDFGYKDVREASDGKEGLFQLRIGGYGLVIADWNMPQMTGIELLRTMRNDPALANVPFIMLTARSEKECIQEALDAGVSGYIVKPFTQEALADRLRHIFKTEPVCRPEGESENWF